MVGLVCPSVFEIARGHSRMEIENPIEIDSGPLFLEATELKVSRQSEMRERQREFRASQFKTGGRVSIDYNVSIVANICDLMAKLLQ